MRTSIKSALFTLHDKHERWEALEEVEHKLSDRAFYDLFVWVWTDSESNGRVRDVIDRLIAKRGVCAAKVMPCLDKEEQEFFAALPDELTIYRGCSLESMFSDYSWTLSRDKAAWFGSRSFSGTPAVAKGTVRKEDVLFTYTGRGEQEVAVTSGHIRDRSLRQIASPKKRSETSVLYYMIQTGQMFSAYSPEMMAANLMTESREPAGICFEGQIQRQIENLRRLGFDGTAKRRETALQQAKTTLGKVPTSP